MKQHNHGAWFDEFHSFQQSIIESAVSHERIFAHFKDSQDVKVIMARMVQLLDSMERQIEGRQVESPQIQLQVTPAVLSPEEWDEMKRQVESIQIQGYIDVSG